MIRVRVVESARSPGNQFVVDNLDNEYGILTLNDKQELEDAIKALEAARNSPSRAYVVCKAGAVTVDMRDCDGRG